MYGNNYSENTPDIYIYISLFYFNIYYNNEDIIDFTTI